MLYICLQYMFIVLLSTTCLNKSTLDFYKAFELFILYCNFNWIIKYTTISAR